MSDGTDGLPAGTIEATVEVVEGLNDLLQLDHDALASYTVAIERLDDREQALQIQGFKDDHERHVRKLTDVILALGGVPLNEPHPTAPLKEAIQRIAAAGGDRVLLAAWRTNELQITSTYDSYARKARFWPPEAKRVVDENALDEERHYEWVLGELGGDGDKGGASDAVRDGIARARARTTEAQGRLGRAASHARLRTAAGLEEAAARLQRLADGGRGTDGIRARAAEGAHRIAESFDTTASFLRNTGRDRIRQAAEQEIRTSPARSLGITLVVGFVVGRILR